MKRCLQNQYRIPYGGFWCFVHPVSGAKLGARNWNNLIKEIKNHHKAMNYPIGLNFEQWVEAQICQSQPNECENCTESGNRIRVDPLSYDTVLRGTNVLVHLMAQKALHMVGLADDPLVNQEEAERRSEICVKCPYNVSYRKPCRYDCGPLKAMVALVKGSRTTNHEGALQSCAVCGCAAAAHVWVVLPLLAKGLNEEHKLKFKEAEKETGCWKIVS